MLLDSYFKLITRESSEGIEIRDLNLNLNARTSTSNSMGKDSEVCEAQSKQKVLDQREAEDWPSLSLKVQSIIDGYK